MTDYSNYAIVTYASIAVQTESKENFVILFNPIQCKTIMFNVALFYEICLHIDGSTSAL